MIYTVSQYIKLFTFSNRRVSGMTIRRKCDKGLLPSNHHAIKLPGDTSPWIIEVKEDEPKNPGNTFEIV
jgi:hypothetical protein